MGSQKVPQEAVKTLSLVHPRSSPHARLPSGRVAPHALLQGQQAPRRPEKNWTRQEDSREIFPNCCI